jgi:ligand-binding SRPBCC domain-containing protein
MPSFDSEQFFPRPMAEVFDFFRRPANLVRVSPPELHMRLVEGPELLELGSHLVVAGRRWGIPQRIASEVTRFERDVGFVDEQREGPFRRWIHTHLFAEAPGGTRVRDEIFFEPPGGILGLVVGESTVRRDLEWVFQYRNKALRELLGGD